MSDFRSAFALLLEGRLDRSATRAAFEAILSGAWTPTQLAALLAALRARGETAEQIVGAAEAMRAAMVPVERPAGVPVLDTCGTGGDGTGSLNLSTAAALIVAGAGVVVAKHGNRAVSSRAGSADVLEALRVPMGLDAVASAALLREHGFAFLLAPTHHPAMRHAAPVRRELGVRTLFNLLGPLSNPARATHQLLGAFADELRPVLARTLGELGVTRAWVVRGEDGLDEVSPHAPTRVTVLEHGELRETVVTPEEFGLPRSAPEATRGGDASENAAAIEAILRGQPHAARDAVVLNAAAALLIAGRVDSPRAGTELARATLENGAALRTLEALRAAGSSQ